MAFFVTSCDEDTLQENITPESNPQVENLIGAALSRALPPTDGTNENGFDSLLCFNFNFPLSFLLEDGTTVSFENEEALEESIEFETPIADFVYPFTITLADGTESTIEGFEGLLEVLTTCYGDFEDWDEEGEWDDEDHGECPDDFDFEAECFAPVFPLTISVNGENVTLADEAAFEAYLATIEGDTITAFELVFPFSVQIFADSTIVEITSEEDLDEVIEACGFGDWDDEGEWDDEDWGGPFGMDSIGVCFTVNYPVGLLLDGQLVTVNSDEELAIALENAEEVEEVEFVFPLSVTDNESGEVVNINDEEELEDLIVECFGDFGGGFGGDFEGDFDEFENCFTLNFPVDLVINGQTVTIGSEEELGGAIIELGDVEELEINFAYPITVTLTESDEEVIINNEEEWEALCDACHEGEGGDLDGEFDEFGECFEINFPLNILLGGETVSIADEAGLEAIFTEGNIEEFGGFVFPLSLTIIETGEVVTVNNEEELVMLQLNCD